MKTVETHIKRLTSSRSNLSKDIDSLNKQVFAVNKEILTKRKEISEIDKKLAQTSKGFAISEHAILRILERAYEQGDMIEKVKMQLEQEIKPKLEALGVANCEMNLLCGLTAVIKNNLVVTIK
jgi:predicted  nucleic acid-binding Zn-ribbon protein